MTSLREEKPPARPKPASAGFKPPRFLSRAWIIAAAGAAASLLLGIIIYVATDNGRIKIEVNDPNAVVKIDGKEVRVEGLGEPITLSVGEHDYLVRWGNGEFETDRFVVRRGDNEALKIEYEPKGKGLVRPPALANATDGFTPLFNGKDLTGWVTPKDKNLFTVEDGLIVGKTDGKLAKNEFLATAKPYGDFVLKASVKLRSGNSGIQFRSKRADDGTVSGPQADIGKGYWGQLYEERGRSILDSIPEAKATMLVHEDDWNNFVITARGNHVTIALNGLVVNELDDPMFDRSGIIALQVHMGPGTEVRFKDIEIKEISPISPPSPPDSNSTGWVSLFNGKDLAGWAGDVSDYEILDGTSPSSRASGPRSIIRRSTGTSPPGSSSGSRPPATAAWRSATPARETPHTRGCARSRSSTTRLRNMPASTPAMPTARPSGWSRRSGARCDRRASGIPRRSPCEARRSRSSSTGS